MALNKIHLAGEVTRDTGKNSTDAAVTPGYALELKSDGSYKAQATASGDNPLVLAEENTAFNKALSDTYATGDQMAIIFPMPGAKVQVWLKSGGSAVVVGDKVEYDTAGKFKKLNTGVVKGTVVVAADPTAADVMTTISVK